MERNIAYQFTAGTQGFDRAVESIERNMRDARSTFNRELRAINTDMVGSQTQISRLGTAANDAFGFVGAKIKGDMLALGASMAAVFSAVAIKDFVSDSKAALLEQQSAYRGLEAVANHAGVGIGRAMEEAQKLAADGLINVGDAAKSLQNLLSRGYNVDQAVAVISRLKDAAAFNRQANLSMSEAVVSATEGLKNENSVLVDNAGVTKNVAKMWEEYAKSIGTTRDKLSDSQKIQAEYTGILKETEAQVGNSTKASEGLTGSQAELDAKSNELKVTIGTILEPAFISLNKRLAETASWFNGVLKGLTGAGVTVNEVAGNVARLEAMLANLGNKGPRGGGGKAQLEGSLQEERLLLEAMQLTSDKIEQVDAGMKSRLARIEEQRLKVAEMAATGNTTLYTVQQGKQRPTAYGLEVMRQTKLEAAYAAAIEHRKKLQEGNTPPPPAKTDTTTGSGGASKSRVSQWAEVLDAQKVAHTQQQAEQGTFQQFSLQKEVDYWQAMLQRTDLSAAERLSVQRKYLGALTSLRKQDEGSAFADLQAQAQMYRNNMDARLQIAQQVLDRSRQLYGQDSEEYRQAASEVVAIEREKQQQITNMKQQQLAADQQARLTDISHAEQMAQLDLQANLITQGQLLQSQAEFEQQRYAIEAAALAQRKQLLEQDPDRNPVALQQVQQQILALEQTHRNSMSVIGRQQTMESQSNWSGMMGSVRSSWTSGLNGILTGTMSTQGILNGIFGSIGTAFIENMVTAPLMAWMFGETAKTGATVTGVGIRTAAEAGGAAMSVAIWGAASIKNIMASAWQAMAGAFAAMTAIPIIGPALGVAAAVAAGAFVFGLVKNVASAEGGYDIPAGTNPLTQLHEQEMVLPKQYANVIRQAANGEGQLGGGGVYHYNDHSGRLTPADIRRNARVFAEEMQKLRRNGAIKA